MSSPRSSMVTRFRLPPRRERMTEPGIRPKARLSIMRWPFVGGRGHIGFRVLQAFGERCELSRQRIDLLPLRRDGLVQLLDGLVLIGEARLQRVDPFGQFLLTHA